MEVENDKLFILDVPTNYIEAIPNIDSKKQVKTMKYEMNSMYISQLWTLVNLPKMVI